ncbi:MAG: hypothetical protein M3004_03340 [Bacteroidota bacterium]|nr:hypothetical protein [Bacteroidota bacterium]
MKKLLLLLTAFCVFVNSFAAFEVKPVAKKATEIFLPIGNTGQKISLMDLSTINVKDFEKISGKHLNFFDRLSFKAGQKKLRNSIGADGTINNKKLLKFTDSDGDHSTGFHLGGFALGLLLGIIGVLLAYVIGGDEDVKRNRAKWAWIGFGIYVVVVVILVIAQSKG